MACTDLELALQQMLARNLCLHFLGAGIVQRCATSHLHFKNINFVHILPQKFCGGLVWWCMPLALND